MSVKDKAWEEVQVKAFSHWVNSYMPADLKLTNLHTDFGDGLRLILLLEALTGNKLKKRYNKTPKTRVHYIENIHLALMLLKESNRIKNTNFGAEDFADGNLKLILGFLWTCLRTFRIGLGGDETSNDPFEEQLLAWLRDKLAEYDLPIKDFTSSLENGQVLCALLHKYDNSFIDYAAVDPSKKLDNVTNAFKSFEEKLSIPQLIEATTLANGDADERSVVLYVSLLQHAFAAKDKDNAANQQKAGFTNKMAELQAKLDSETAEKNELLETKASMQKELDDLRAQLEALKKRNAELEAEVSRLQQIGGDASDKSKYLADKLDVMSAQLKSEIDEKTELAAAKGKLERDFKNLQREKSELESEKEHLAREKEALEAEHKSMMDAMERFNQAKKKLEAQYAERAGHELKGLDALRKNLIEHLTDMNSWKGYLEQDREYKSATIQGVSEKAIAGQSTEDQLAYLNTALAAENSKLQALLKEHEAEQVSKKGEAGGAKAPAADGKLSESGDKKPKKKAK